MTTASASAASGTEAQRLLEEHANKELVRFITCGSVDDGKSTLIGRLLLETAAVHEDQLAALREESRRHGSVEGELDAALLLDGLEDERQQGITIDVAYRYFTTAKRKFIIADTPGHEQFTRNMVTGASTANLAVVLVDARKGILSQTRRHAFIASLMGIKHAILAVNKMDLVGYDEPRFEAIREDFRRFADRLEIPDIRFVPLSALKGDNVAEPSANTLWYGDGSLLHLLETIYVGADRSAQELRFPIQWVNRPHSEFRGFSGTLSSGTMRRGDEVVALPSRKRSRIGSIVAMDGQLAEAHEGDSVTVVLDDEIDVARGDVLVRAGDLPRISRDAEAVLVWMSEQPLVPGKQYWVKHTTRRTSGRIESIRHGVDVNTLDRRTVRSLKLNEIGRCRIAVHDPLVFDPYSRNRQTGSFILVDRITHETVAAGMLCEEEPDSGSTEHWEDQPPGHNLKLAMSRITADQRRQRLGHKPVTILLAGLSGSGKTTIALELEKRIFEDGYTSVLLDGQNLRFGISRDLGFSAEERSENLRRAAEIAKLVNDAGLICIAAFVAPHADIREKARKVIGRRRVLHVHLSAPVQLCRQRDTTGRYAAADRGEIHDFPGVTSSYTHPGDADLILPTGDLSIGQCVDAIRRLVVERGYLADE